MRIGLSVVISSLQLTISKLAIATRTANRAIGRDIFNPTVRVVASYSYWTV